MPQADGRRSVSNPSQPASGTWSVEDLIAAVEAGPTGPHIGAFFDFDGTLIDGYSLSAFVRHHLRSLQVTPADLGRMLLTGIRGVASEEDFEQFTVLSMHTWARSEERRVGKECRARWSPYRYKKSR